MNQSNPAAIWDTSIDLNELDDVLTLDSLGTDRFRAPYTFDDPRPLYGGQVLAQSLLAATKTVDGERMPHSMHGYFLRGGSSREPVQIDIARDFDGRSFASRRVIATQGESVIFSGSLSFAVTMDGPDHQHPTSPGWDPAQLHDFPSGRLQSMELRALTPYAEGLRLPREFAARFTADLGDLGDDPTLQLAALAYLSDVSSGLADVQGPDVDYLASIDHAVWFHQVPDLREWHLVELEPRRTGAGRGLFSGGIFDAAGNLVASTMQESLFRYRRPSAP